MNHEENIRKKCSLDDNDSISTYLNWGAQQHFNTFEVFYNFIGEVKPKRFLEIGTALGGLTCFLKYSCNKLNVDCDILTYDILAREWYSELEDMNIDVRIENIFNHNYTKVSHEVINFIQKEGTTIILCDGGDKTQEFNILSNFLKDGDFILAHDYAENDEVFIEKIYGKIWNWLEIHYSDIKNAVERNNLQPFNKNVFESVAWTCWQKKKR